jgi:hypothetical protein
MAGDSSDSRVTQMLKHGVGMVAAAGAFKALQLTWKRVTGKEPPLGPDDEQAPLGRAIAWTLVMGAAITTARMIAIRYTSKLLRGQQQTMTESAVQPIADNPGTGVLDPPAQVSTDLIVNSSTQETRSSSCVGRNRADRSGQIPFRVGWRNMS